MEVLAQLEAQHLTRFRKLVIFYQVIFSLVVHYKISNKLYITVGTVLPSIFLGKKEQISDKQGRQSFGLQAYAYKLQSY